MPHVSERIEFAPPQQPGNLRALAFALMAHLLLVVALTWGVRWKQQTDAGVEAELWSSVPQIAAPKAVEPPPPPPKPQPKVEAQPDPPKPVPREAEIATEREKKKREEAKQREEEKDRKEKQAERDKQEREKRQAAEEKTKQATAQKQKEADEKKQDAARREKDRQDNIARAVGMAGATGAANATGNAQRSSGPSSGYAGRIRARVKPNIVFTEDIEGNPSAEVEVRCAPDGTITGQRIVKSSGNRAWDEAVLRALERTEVLPKDTDGRVPSPMLITFRPKD
jgi:colicin import membrane protein